MDHKSLIKKFILTELVQDKKHADLSDGDPLIDSGVIDSLGIMKLIGFLEEELSVEISDMELIPENFASLEAISNLVDQKTANA